MIQAELYKRSKKLVKRNTGVLFYDCTNYFFEMEHEGGLKQYGPRDDRIEAHFLTCFIALMIYRILEKNLGDKFTCEEIIKTLREMDMRKGGLAAYLFIDDSQLCDLRTKG